MPVTKTSLQVRSFGKGPNRAKVVLFPGHEFEIGHFFPENLLYAGAYLGHRQRVQVVASKFKEKPVKFWRWTIRTERTPFIAKTDRRASMSVLDAPSEARLARFVRQLKIPGVHVEEPLAAILRPGREHEVIYRPLIEFEKPTELHQQTMQRLFEKLKEHGISPGGLVQWFPGKNGTVHLFDLEEWGTTTEARQKLNLRSPVRRTEKRSF